MAKTFSVSSLSDLFSTLYELSLDGNITGSIETGPDGLRTLQLTLQEQRQALSEEAQTALSDLLTAAPITVALGPGLQSLLRGRGQGALQELVLCTRASFAEEYGFWPAPITVETALRLPPRTYHIRLFGGLVASGEVFPEQLLAIGSEDELAGLGSIVREPTFGLPGVWIQPSQQLQAELTGVMVVTAASAIVTHLSEVMHKNSYKFMTYKEAQELLSSFPQSEAGSTQQVCGVLRRLLEERVSIRETRGILDVIASRQAENLSLSELTEEVRCSLSQQITAAHVRGGSLSVWVLSEEAEQLVMEGQGEELLGSLREAAAQAEASSLPAVLLVQSFARRIVADFVLREIPIFFVIRSREISPSVSVEIRGRISPQRKG